jgi:UDP-glucuronate decarboxylase
VTFLPLPQDDPRRRRPDITRAKLLLGWSPRVPLREGLLQTIAYFADIDDSAIEPITTVKTSTSGKAQNLPV